MTFVLCKFEIKVLGEIYALYHNLSLSAVVADIYYRWRFCQGIQRRKNPLQEDEERDKSW